MDADLAALFAASPDLIGVLASDGTVVVLSRDVAGVSPEQAKGRALSSLVVPAYAREVVDAIARAAHAPARVQVQIASARGERAHYQLTISPSADGRLALVGADVSERREIEERLRRAEELLVDAQGTAHLGTWEWDPSQPHAVWSNELYRIYGVTPAEYTPSYEGYLTKVHPDDRAHVMAATERVFRAHEPYSHDERILRPDGAVRYLHTWAHAIVDHEGKLERLIGVCQDITDRKLAELALEQRAEELSRTNELLRLEMEERARVEKLLRRAQTLEALGRLTGGIAHDFNNVLGVVIGYASMMYSRCPPDAPEKEYLAEMMSATERAGRMIQQLLAFSRDQVIERGPLALDRVVLDLAELIRRLIGEKCELVLELHESTAPGEPVLLVDANRSQVEQVLVNLAVNARDAMPQGGALTIATHALELRAGDAPWLDLAPGAYGCLTVADSGVGMSEEVQGQIFDPFFTTKEDGKGTGLGLSTVYGIVKQSDGAISVASAPGQGTRFSIALRRAEPRADAARRIVPRDTPARATETVLLVEDQPALRAVIREALRSFGYAVLDSGDPIDALRRASEHAGPIDVLLTDVVMPKLSGRELAERVLAVRPSVRVMYMSGYATDVVLREGVIERGVALLRKPFAPNELAERLRALLDAPAS